MAMDVAIPFMAEEDGIGGRRSGGGSWCCIVVDGGEESGGHEWSASLDS